jgi:hypothetical protein
MSGEAARQVRQQTDRHLAEYCVALVVARSGLLDHRMRPTIVVAEIGFLPVSASVPE